MGFKAPSPGQNIQQEQRNVYDGRAHLLVIGGLQEVGVDDENWENMGRSSCSLLQRWVVVQPQALCGNKPRGL